MFDKFVCLSSDGNLILKTQITNTGLLRFYSSPIKFMGLIGPYLMLIQLLDYKTQNHFVTFLGSTKLKRNGYILVYIKAELYNLGA